MRIKVATIIFFTTFAVSLGLVSLDTFLVEWSSPGFSAREATEMIGHRVRNVYWDESFLQLKCPPNSRLCSDVKPGDRGTIVGMEETGPDEYFGVIQWDSNCDSQPLESHFGRMSRRIFLKIE